ncbi:Melibiase family protein [Obelidium mucronatum]|nr:Melibiase family protein [Obelidium mucronatum]
MFKGLAKLGYIYVNVDDCWQASRSENGFIQEDKNTFPSGMKALSDYVHSKGLKFGLYSSAGLATCEGRPGGLHYESKDAQSYAEWGVDYIKYDNCLNDGRSNKSATIERYGALRDALNATGRPMNYALCSWGEVNIWEFGNELGNSWRTTLDIQDNWNSIMSIIRQNQHLSHFSRPGGFNDMDMLEVGNGHMSTREYRTHYSVWAALKSPLLLGHDLTKTTSTTLSILANPEMIAINQDPLGKSAVLRARSRNVWVWVGELVNKERVLVVLNAGWKDVDVTVGFSVLSAVAAAREDSKLFGAEDVMEIDQDAAGGEEKEEKEDGLVVNVRDLWDRLDWKQDFKRVIPVGRIPYHGVKVLKVVCKAGRFGSLDGAGELELIDGKVGGTPVVQVVEHFSWGGLFSSCYRKAGLVVPCLISTFGFIVAVVQFKRFFTFSKRKGNLPI